MVRVQGTKPLTKTNVLFHFRSYSSLLQAIPNVLVQNQSACRKEGISGEHPSWTCYALWRDGVSGRYSFNPCAQASWLWQPSEQSGSNGLEKIPCCLGDVEVTCFLLCPASQPGSGNIFSTFLYGGASPKSSHLSSGLFMSRDVAKECLL